MGEIDVNHPCRGKSCEECETCLFDVDIFKDGVKPNKKINLESCNFCDSLIRNYVGDYTPQFNACCGRCIIDYGEYSRPRTIVFKVGASVDIKVPSWCPRERGIFKEQIPYKLLNKDNKQLSLPYKDDDKPKKPLTYTEKKELIEDYVKSNQIKPHLKWDEIEVGSVYVLPKFLTISRKVIKVMDKLERSIRFVEIEDDGKESTYSQTLWKDDIDAAFLVKLKSIR